MLSQTFFEAFYPSFAKKAARIRKVVGRSLTYSEKILYSHLFDEGSARKYERLRDYVDFRPDRVAMQDATGQMALLQFMNAGRDSVSVPASIHCDHLIRACKGGEDDLQCALNENDEVYRFLKSASSRFCIDFWKPGAGIIHQIVLENYAFPGGMMVGTDSHTPNAGGLGMLAIAVGGADAVDVLTAMPWELRMPKIIGIELTGELHGWASPKDVILELVGMLTVKGGSNSILEYFGPGTETLSCTGKATICNMGAEVGATSSIFPFDAHGVEYLKATGRARIAELAESAMGELRADKDVIDYPEEYYDEVISINLSEVHPHINGPFTPDASSKVRDMKQRIKEKGFPEKVEVSLIGSCTNSTYQDLARAASVAQAAIDAGLKPKSKLIVVPGSSRIRATAERDGILNVLRKAGATIMANACGPCIGQWKREIDDPTRRNSIVTTFNRNFAKRADGNPNTNAFIVSPETAVALSFAGSLCFDPESDEINGFKFPEPVGPELPPDGFAECESGCIEPKPDSPEPEIRPDSDRIQKLEPFPAWDGKDFIGLPLLIKVKGKCTTDHISMAGPWLKYRGHLENISENLLMGAMDAFTGKTGPVAGRAKAFRDSGTGSIIVAEDNYGEGSSREQAAMEPRFLGVKVVLAKSFARIHETNLKKQGMLALTFADSSDYDKIHQDDTFDVHCSGLTPGKSVGLTIHHADGSTERIVAEHTYNELQISWFRDGSALNHLRKC
jgi:aconitate hydratase